MARQKTPENKKRKKITATIDSRLFDMLDEYMLENGYDVGDKSKLIEKLIKNEIKEQTLSKSEYIEYLIKKDQKK